MNVNNFFVPQRKNILTMGIKTEDDLLVFKEGDILNALKVAVAKINYKIDFTQIINEQPNAFYYIQSMKMSDDLIFWTDYNKRFYICCFGINGFVAYLIGMCLFDIYEGKTKIKINFLEKNKFVIFFVDSEEKNYYTFNNTFNIHDLLIYRREQLLWKQVKLTYQS